MGTTTTLKLTVNLLEKSVTYMCNLLLRLGLRIEHHRVGSDYMAFHLKGIAKGLRVWLTEQTLEKVTYEIYDPASDQAYEVCEVPLEYIAEAKEEVTTLPLAQLEELLTTLEKLPPGAAFRLVVNTAPGASHVPGWVPTTLKDLKGGVKEEHQLGEEGGFGFAHIFGHPRYVVANWQKHQTDMTK